MGSCSKCGKKQLYPVYGTHSTPGITEPTALIQFRSTFTMNVDGVPTNFYAASVQHLSYSLIATIAELNPEVLIFKNASEKAIFLIVNPSLRGVIK